MDDNRDLLFDELIKTAIKNKKYVFLCNDMDVFSLINFKKKYPKRVINVGVAEQNLVNVAAGLASQGFIPIVYGILPFLVYRCFEQIKFNIDSMQLKVLFIGIGTGHSFSWDGPTHYGVTDLSILNSLPNFLISNPIDKTSIISTLNVFKKIKNKSMFIRLEKGEFKNIDKDIYEKNGFRLIKKNKNIKNILITSGLLTNLYYFSDVRNRFDILDLVFLNKINFTNLKKILFKYKKILIADENYSGSSIIDLIYPALMYLKRENIKIVIPNNNQELFYASREAILKKYKLTPKSILKVNV